MRGINFYITVLIILCFSFISASTLNATDEQNIYKVVVKSYPSSMIPIGVSPADINGKTDGNTVFTRKYHPGTPVTLTAPLTYEGKVFSHWKVNDVEIPVGVTLQLMMDKDYKVWAKYKEGIPYVLTVKSTPIDGVPVGVNPQDINNNGAGNTEFNRTFLEGSNVALSAPAEHGGLVFSHWLVEGAVFTVPNIQVFIDNNKTAQVFYKERTFKVIVRSYPKSEAPIGVSPTDITGKSNGNTVFTRKYTPGTNVILTAPLVFEGYVFSHWKVDGTDMAVGPVLNLTMNRDHEVWAKYKEGTPYVLTVKSTPINGVPVGVTPNDYFNNGAGNTEFQRTYLDGANVALSAPAQHGGLVFSHWLVEGNVFTDPVTQVFMNANKTAQAFYKEPHFNLVVRSAPDSLAPISISPTDLAGHTNGNTVFTRKYSPGTMVTAIAPPTHMGKVFSKWQLDGVDYGTNATVQVTMDKNHELYAKYVIPVYTLTVQSLPDTGAPITVTPPDNNHEGNGNTNFQRKYNGGTTVSVTAPGEYNGKVFVKWQIDGADNTNAAIQVLMDGDHTVTAYYEVPTYTLTVKSSPIKGVSIAVSPNDNGNQGSGKTEFQRVYNAGTTVHVSAPLYTQEYIFVKWMVDGADNADRAISVPMNGNHTVEAIYKKIIVYTLYIKSQPDTGVGITVDPIDNDGRGNGITNYNLKYNAGTLVTVTAPDEHNSKRFVKWLVDGAPNANRTIQVTMNSNHTVEAIYQEIEYHTLYIKSQPDTGAGITVDPIDKDGRGNDNTNFDRKYNSETVVTVTAPGEHKGKRFVNWLVDGQAKSNRIIQVTMNSDHTVIAVYRPVYTLTVKSSPDTGAPISINPNDNSGQGNGSTQFVRTYNDGDLVTVTAPPSFNQKPFVKWLIDGVANPATTIQVTMNTNHVVEAIYQTPTFKLDVRSLPQAGAYINLFPNDISSVSSGSANFIRIYNVGEVVNLTADLTYNGMNFVKWQVDGQLVPGRSITVTMNTNHVVEAVYAVPTVKLTVLSAPYSGTPIAVSPDDQGGNGNGDTTFERVYAVGAQVTASAPDTYNGLSFSHWELDGTQQEGRTITVNMDADHTVKAVYRNELFKLEVKSSPDTGAPMTVDPVDEDGRGDGAANFIRTYKADVQVTVTAPPSHEGKIFSKWIIDGSVEDPERIISVTMDADHVVEAIYEKCTHTLTVKSTPIQDVFITVNPKDINKKSDGKTRFTRVYECDTNVTLTAPDATGCIYFSKWVVKETGQEIFTPVIQLEMDKDYTVTAHYGEACAVGAGIERLSFGAIIDGPVTSPQNIIVGNSGGGKLHWNINANRDWIGYSQASGTNSQFVEISANPAGLSVGTYTGHLNISGNTSEFGRTVEVIFTIYEQNGKQMPFGEVITPVDNSTVSRHVPITGWVLDHIECTDVTIFYAPGEDTRNRVQLGKAVFIDDARPELETEFPHYPRNHRSGWGYMLHTNMLPNQGNGTFVITAVATDIVGNEVLLGTRVINVDNAGNHFPFGIIETPESNRDCSGMDFISQAWAVTAQPYTIPEDGSTFKIWINGLPQPNCPQYNMHHREIAEIFDALNNGEGAMGQYVMDTTRFCNGTHNITWSVCDDGGNLAAIGSRFFDVLNPGCPIMAPQGAYKGQGATTAFSPVLLRRGYDLNAPFETVAPNAEGIIEVSAREDQRIELRFNEADINNDPNDWYYGYHRIGDMYKMMPTGSVLDTQNGFFTWQPGAGYIGTYTLVLVKRSPNCEFTNKIIRITINPRFPNQD